MNDVFAVSDRIAALYLGRMAAQVKATEVTHSQVVELITAGRSGNLGLPSEKPSDFNGDVVDITPGGDQ
jgi:D-xylose transport system ATP-binding protein